MAKKKTAKAKLNAYNPRKILDLVIPGQSSVQTIAPVGLRPTSALQIAAGRYGSITFMSAA